jgi:hypothetical protein
MHVAFWHGDVIDTVLPDIEVVLCAFCVRKEYAYLQRVSLSEQTFQ